jgi:hypothetical protein
MHAARRGGGADGSDRTRGRCALRRTGSLLGLVYAWQLSCELLIFTSPRTATRTLSTVQFKGRMSPWWSP